MGRGTRLAGDDPETDPTPVQAETLSHVAERVSWAPSPAALGPVPLPKKASCFVSTCVSPIHSRVLGGHTQALEGGRTPGPLPARVSLPDSFLSVTPRI